MPGVTEPLRPNVTIPQATSRRRPAPTGDEEATGRLKLGDCANEQALSPAEVMLMLEQLERQPGNTHDPTNDIYYKTREYCKHFARFKDNNSITQVNGISTELTSRGLGIVEFERAQLGELEG
jgi:DNA-directed RNA polymerase II subunit RPB4